MVRREIIAARLEPELVVLDPDEVEHDDGRHRGPNLVDDVLEALRGGKGKKREKMRRKKGKKGDGERPRARLLRGEQRKMTSTRENGFRRETHRRDVHADGGHPVVDEGFFRARSELVVDQFPWRYAADKVFLR